MWIVVAIISLILNIVLGSLFFIVVKKLNSFNDFFVGLEKFIFDSINYFDKLLSTPVFLHVPEVIEANNNMKKIRNQLEQFTKTQGGEVVIVHNLLE
jgi:predicted PurR-regulated permease PerM